MDLQEVVNGILNGARAPGGSGDLRLGIGIGGIVLSVSTRDRELYQIGQDYFGQFLSPASPAATLSVSLSPERRAPDALLEFRELTTHTEGEVDYCARWDFCGTIDSARRTARFQLSEAVPQAFDTIVRISYALLATRHEGMLLHASSLAWQGRGYCFVGPSGNGKSTIVKLIEEATALSDESSLVRIVDGTPQVSGTPFHGEVPKYANLTVPLAGVYLLTKSPETRLEPVPKDQAIYHLLRNTMFFGQNARLKKGLLGNAARMADAAAVQRLFFEKNRTFWEAITHGC